MRYVKAENGYSVMVSNDEYSLIRKIKANGKYPLANLDDYYQELGEKLYSKGLLNKITENDKEYFISINRSR